MDETPNKKIFDVERKITQEGIIRAIDEMSVPELKALIEEAEKRLGRKEK